MRLATKALIVAVSQVVVLCVVGCQPEKKSPDEIQAELFLKNYFDALTRKAYDTVIANYDNEFFEDMTRNDWRNTLTAINSKLGNFVRYEVGDHGPDSRAHAKPGTYFKISCRVIYSKHPADETFFLFRSPSASKYKIVAHKIDSHGFASK